MAARQCVARAHHRGRIDVVFSGEGKQQRLVTREVIEHTHEELRIARGFADGGGAYSRHRQEAREPFGIVGNEAERGNGEILGCCLPLPAAARLPLTTYRDLRVA